MDHLGSNHCPESLCSSDPSRACQCSIAGGEHGSATADNVENKTDSVPADGSSLLSDSFLPTDKVSPDFSVGSPARQELGDLVYGTSVADNRLGVSRPADTDTADAGIPGVTTPLASVFSALEQFLFEVEDIQRHEARISYSEDYVSTPYSFEQMLLNGYGSRGELFLNKLERLNEAYQTMKGSK